MASSSSSSRDAEQQREEILNDLMLSPHATKSGPGQGGPGQGGSMSVPKTQKGGGRARRDKSRPRKEHRFHTGLNTKATNCAVCLGSVLFVKQAAKCEGQCRTGVCSIKLLLI